MKSQILSVVLFVVDDVCSGNGRPMLYCVEALLQLFKLEGHFYLDHCYLDFASLKLCPQLQR